MVKTLQDYLFHNKKDYKFIVKLAFEPDQERLDRLERMLDKYNLVEMTKPSKTIFQSNPIDFPSLSYGEIFIFEITVSYPTLSYYIWEDIRNLFKVDGPYVIVRSINNPVEKSIEEFVKNAQEDYIPKLSTDPAYPEAKNADLSLKYGDEYNKEMVEVLTSKDAKEVMNYYREYALRDKNYYPDAKTDVKKNDGPIWEEKKKVV